MFGNIVVTQLDELIFVSGYFSVPCLKNLKIIVKPRHGRHKDKLLLEQALNPTEKSSSLFSFFGGSSSNDEMTSSNEETSNDNLTSSARPTMDGIERIDESELLLEEKVNWRLHNIFLTKPNEEFK